MIKQKKFIRGCGGFTLIELMLTLLISSLIVAAIYAAYTAQQRVATAQEAVVEMQQNLRAAITVMSRDLRMAGYDPNHTAGADIVTATSSRLAFTQDIVGAEPDTVDNDNDGTTDETDGSEPDYSDGVLGGTNEAITYGFSNANDSEPNGIVDDLNGDGLQNDVASLGRDTGGGFQPVAENIQAIDFYYTLKDGSQTTTPTDPAEIRSVQISILARAGQPDRKFTNTRTYTPASGVANWGPYNDKFRRRFLTTSIVCRNMGL